MIAHRVQITGVEKAVGRGRPTLWESHNALAFLRCGSADLTAFRIRNVGSAPVCPRMARGTRAEAVRDTLNYWSIAANISNDLFKGGKRFLPIFRARLSIPVAALGLKKYFCGTFPVSMTPHNVDSLARLGDSEVFAVKHTPSDRIPEFGQSSNNGFEISSSVRMKEAVNVFE